MTGFEMFWPMVAHAFLVFCLYALLVVRRAAVVRSGKVERSAFRENLAEPEESRVVNRAIANQFELPVLFYAALLTLYVTNLAGPLHVALAWGYVAARFAHSWVHCTTNVVMHRFYAFVTS